MTHDGALHGCLHDSGAATRAYVYLTQAQLKAHVVAIVVFILGYGMSAPAYGDIGQGICRQYVGLTQDHEDEIRHEIVGGTLVLDAILDDVGVVHFKLDYVA